MRKQKRLAPRHHKSSLRSNGLRRKKKPGSPPGIENLPDLDVPPPSGTIGVSCLDLGDDRCETHTFDSLDGFFAHERPKWSRIRWINIDELHPFVVHRLMGKYGFHTLSAEDVLTTPQRPKLESHEDHLFIIARMLSIADGHLVNEQVSMFFFNDQIVTFQEQPGDVWELVRKRLQKPGGRFREHGTAYLLCALLDAMVDHLFPVLENFGDSLGMLEEEVLQNPSPQVQQQIHQIKRDLLSVRNGIWPMRDVLNQLYRDEYDLIADEVEIYFRDVQDHAVQVIDMIESLREMASSLNDLYMSSVSHRMNEIMKVLTIIATFFIPLTFLAGVYGMNFHYMPELKWAISYPIFWAICLTVTALLGVYFYRKGWIGNKP